MDLGSDARPRAGMGWRAIGPFRSGDTWSFFLGTSFKQGSVLDAFVDPARPSATRSNSTFLDPAAGAVQVAATATALANGSFRYVYVLMKSIVVGPRP